eukprot:m.118850 g.118850  ORF g.118850 m.118850 type:complete len:644 (-) comp16135_c0_seq2:375-2306(-)
MLRLGLCGRPASNAAAAAVATAQSRVFSSAATAAAASVSGLSGAKVEEYDYVIVGAGSAGCVLANRLTEDPNVRVCLVEAGKSDRGRWDSWKIQIPAALTYNLGGGIYNWFYETEPQKHLFNRVLPWPRGKVLGGSSSLNAMVYIRGHAYDYDRWEEEGAREWAYSNCLPYFRKAQTHELGPDEYRGGDGPLHVTRGKQERSLFQAFIAAGKQAGYPETEDMNGYQQEGFGWMDMTVYKGRRWSTANAYLRPAMKRPNLVVKTDVLTHRVVFEGSRAVGIECSSASASPLSSITTSFAPSATPFASSKNTNFSNSAISNTSSTNSSSSRLSNVRMVAARREVILCGGAINSPQLLLLSGVGDAAQLAKWGIPVKAHLPGVGQNLQDHLDLYVQYRCTKPITLYSDQWRFPHNMVRHGLQWIFFGSGKAASAHLESGGFICSREGLTYPDIQYHFLPGALSGQLNPGSCHAFQAHISTMRPLSRGFIELQSADPRAPPRIQPNYLEHPQDLVDLRAAVKLTREIFQQQAFDAFRADPISPSAEIQTDQQIDDWIRAKTESAYHPCCTVRMGEDEGAVVDSAARVRGGIANLRVVDASIMPSMISGNLNAPTIMMAEKLADAIRGRPPLPESFAPVYRRPTRNQR